MGKYIRTYRSSNEFDFSPVLQNTGAGISSLTPLKEKIRIGVNEDAQLQMIFFGGDNGKSNEKEFFERVRWNESYS